MKRGDIKSLQIVEVGQKTYIGIVGEDGNITEALQYNGTQDLGKYVKARNDGTVKTITLTGQHSVIGTGLNDEEVITLGTLIDLMSTVDKRFEAYYKNKLFDEWNK